MFDILILVLSIILATAIVAQPSKQNITLTSPTETFVEVKKQGMELFLNRVTIMGLILWVTAIFVHWKFF